MMNVQLAKITPQPLEEIYVGYRVCYSKLKPHEIAIPSDINTISNFVKPLIVNGHLTPLEHVSMTFYISGVSRALMAQLTRHRTSSLNCQSQRYVDANNFEFVTPPSIKNNPSMLAKYEQHMKDTINLYNEMVDTGIKKEDARFVLPNASDSNIVMTIDLRNFRHFYGLRNCVAAQWEIRELSQKMMALVKEYIPFADYNAKNCGRTCFDCVNKWGE